jgi:hypothetical protein
MIAILRRHTIAVFPGCCGHIESPLDISESLQIGSYYSELHKSYKPVLNLLIWWKISNPRGIQ